MLPSPARHASRASRGRCNFRRHADDQGVQLGHDRIAGPRTLQAPPQQRQRLGRPLRLLVERAEVEQGEWVVGPLVVLDQQEPQVALELPAPQAGILVPRMLDHDVGPPQVHSRPSQRRQDLLVDPVTPSGLGEPAEEPDLVDRRRPPSSPARPGSAGS